MGLGDNATETTRLTQSGSSMRDTMSTTMTNPYLYTETYGEESKTVDLRPPQQTVNQAERDSCGRGNESSLFLFDESTIADIDEGLLDKTSNSIKSAEKAKEDD